MRPLGLCLDPDSKVTWHSDFETLVYGEEVWPKIETKLSVGEISTQTFFSELTCSDEALKDDLACLLRQKAREILFTEYSHVIGYHGCRPRDLKSYRKHGILPSDIDRLICEARSIFQGIQGFDQALDDIGTIYLNHNAGKVGLLLSAVRAMNDPANSHANGRELIRALAYRLGDAAESVLEASGKPTFIKCRIPVEWLGRVIN